MYTIYQDKCFVYNEKDFHGIMSKSLTATPPSSKFLTNLRIFIKLGMNTSLDVIRPLYFFSSLPSIIPTGLPCEHLKWEKV